MSGLFTIPVAEAMQDGEVNLAVFYLPKKYNSFANNVYDAYIFSSSIGFLPFLEFGLRITRPDPHPSDDLGDRMFSLKLRLIEENTFIPAVSFGAHDFILASGNEEANYFNSLYLVATKNIENLAILESLSVTIGYGSDVMDASAYQFVGLFGGVKASVEDWLEILLEYDAERMNSAVRIKWWHLRLLAGYLDNKDFTGGISVWLRL
jgi:hypothetical protein